MIDINLYDEVKNKFGKVASWAVWDVVGTTPKSNMGNMDIFDIEKNPALLKTLKNNIIMVGLNFSRPIATDIPFLNFHDSSPYANDFKIRYAIRNTEYYGAYMTDVIKNAPYKTNKETLLYLKENPQVIKNNIAVFRQEISVLGSRPVILAFGKDAYKIVNDYLNDQEYLKIIRLTHYSHFISKENYKIAVMNQINQQA